MNDINKELLCIHGKYLPKLCDICIEENKKINELLEIKVHDTISSKDLGPGQKK